MQCRIKILGATRHRRDVDSRRLDGRRLSPPEGFLIRKAPGNDSFDFGQFVDFSPGSTVQNTPVLKHGRRFDDKENESVRSCVVLANFHAVEQTRLRDAIASMEL